MLLRAARDSDGIAEAISWVMRAEAADVAPAARLLAQINEAYPEPIVADARMLSDLAIGDLKKTPSQ